MTAITKTHWLAIGVAAAVIVGAAAFGFSLLGGPSEPKTSPSPTPTPTPTVTVSPATGSAVATIQGRKIFPSEAIPADFRVCAANLASHAETCTAAGGAPTYRLQVPAGSYRVYAIVPSFDGSYRAYYSRFVTCGLRAECTDHSPLTVTVAAGQTVDGIDAGDFYR